MVHVTPIPPILRTLTCRVRWCVRAGPGTLTPRDENGPVTKLNHAFALEKVVAFMHELQEIVLAGNRLHQISGFKETFYSGAHRPSVTDTTDDTLHHATR